MKTIDLGFGLEAEYHKGPGEIVVRDGAEWPESYIWLNRKQIEKLLALFDNERTKGETNVYHCS